MAGTRHIKCTISAGVDEPELQFYATVNKLKHYLGAEYYHEFIRNVIIFTAPLPCFHIRWYVHAFVFTSVTRSHCFLLPYEENTITVCITWSLYNMRSNIFNYSVCYFCLLEYIITHQCSESRVSFSWRIWITSRAHLISNTLLFLLLRPSIWGIKKRLQKRKQIVDRCIYQIRHLCSVKFHFQATLLNSLFLQWLGLHTGLTLIKTLLLISASW